MNVLRKAFESLGCSDVVTFLGSGNVIFETRTKDARTLDSRIERRLYQILGRRVPVFIRTLPELKKIATLKPFNDSKIRGASVNVILLAEDLDDRSTLELMTLGTETDGFRVHGREIYWWRHKKPGTSLFATVPLAKVLREPVTVRSTNTIKRLVAKWR
jgi:uncharacterized protein (DUF1697 family)